MTQTGWWFTEDPTLFLDVAGEFLAADPLQFTVLTTVASRAVAERAAGTWVEPEHPFWFAAWRDGDGEVASATMRTAPFAPHPLWVLGMPDEAASDLAVRLLERGEALPGEPFGVNGDLSGAQVCAEALAAGVGSTEGTGGTVSATMHSRLFRCDEVVVPARPAGVLRRAGEEDVDLVVTWFEEFHAEADAQAGRTPAPGAVSQINPDDARRRAHEGHIWLWEVDGEVVHMTGTNTVSYGTVRIGPVFTPRAHRGRGYAAWVVAEVTRSIQTDGHLPCLFTDQANPVSNEVYQRIGYTAVADTVGLVVS